MNEILFIDKPKGITSFDVIRILRKKTGIRKMGHAGTLDPAATGLMIIGVEKGTKKLESLLGFDKTYEMDIKLGVKTDSGDMDGKIIEEKKVGKIDLNKLEEILKNLVGERELEVSVYSAIKLKGKPLYKYARAGEKVEAPKRIMKIISLKFLPEGSNLSKNILRVEMRCGKGTYARSVGEEIGRQLGYPATLSDLRRTSIGDYKVEDAKKLEDF
jgi:tRNA pseudouridine55 synthase